MLIRPSFRYRPGSLFPKAFALEELPGLLFCHVIRSASGDKVTACWVDEDHSRAYLKTFSTKTGMNTVALSAGPESEGAIVEVEYPETPWWKLWKKLEEYSIRELLIGLLAITGAILGIRDYFAVFFAAPDVTISYADAGHVDTVEGGQFTVPLTIRSEIRFAPASVRFVRAQIQTTGDQARQVTLCYTKSILPGKV